ncbi:hypothetical protein S2091_2469 [Solimicrobium silvestre]|uniref:Uncharacterized protein n=1 Tax=Solimicrobium silvestre TaxID=2099400 RepID=A0A2S9GYD9_9BURK|nr:hypothetical protein S2091_2469 [Solimicrobium silvestre]
MITLIFEGIANLSSVRSSESIVSLLRIASGFRSNARAVQKQSPHWMTHSSRYACRLGSYGSFPLVRNFSSASHGVPGALRAWAPPLEGSRAVLTRRALRTRLVLDAPPPQPGNRSAIFGLLTASFGAAQRGCPSAKRAGTRGCAPRTKTAAWGPLIWLGPNFFGGSPRARSASLGRSCPAFLRQDGWHKQPTFALSLSEIFRFWCDAPLKNLGGF